MKITSILLEPTENGCVATVNCDYGPEYSGPKKFNCDAETFNMLCKKIGLEMTEEIEEEIAEGEAPRPVTNFDYKNYK